MSTKGQEDEGTSLESQAAAGVKHAESLGYTIGRITKEVYTGTELWDRPLLARDRADLKAGTFQALIAYATDRLSRDPIHLAIVAEECERAGAELVFVTEPLDSSAEAALIRYVKGYAAKLEHAKIRERTMRGKRTRAESGRLVFGPMNMYGYRSDRQNGTREVDEVQAAVVRSMYEWVATDGVPIRAVIRRLNQAAIPAPSTAEPQFRDRPAPRWGGGTVSRILREPAYKGAAFAYRNMKVRVPGNSWPAVRIRESSEWVAMPDGNTPAIVSTELWDRAQHRLDTNRGDDTRNGARPYLLRGFMWCSVCGRKMRTSPEHARRVYRCASRETRHGACGGARVRAELIEAEVWREVDRRLRDPALIAREAEAAERRKPDNDVDGLLAKTRRSLAKLEQQQERLIARYRTSDDAGFPWELVEREVARAEEEKTRVRAMIKGLEERQASHQAAAARLTELTQYCERVYRRLDRFDFDQKRLAFEAIELKVFASGKDWRAEGVIFR